MNQVGKHLFKVTAQGFGESKGGTPYFFLEGIPQEFHADDGQRWACDPYQRTITLYITDKTLDSRRKELSRLGFEGRFAQLDPAQPNHHSFVGQNIEAMCKHEAGTGDNASKTYEKWELPYEPATREATASKAGIANKLDALFGKKLGPAARPQQQRREVQPVGNGPGGPEDSAF